MVKRVLSKFNCQLYGWISDLYHKRKHKHSIVNLAKNSRLLSSMDPMGEPTAIILLNEQSIKLFSKFTSLYP